MPPGRPDLQNYANSFQVFFQGWLIRQEYFLDQLLMSFDKPESELNSLISQVLSHYQQYYEAKSVVIRQDVFVLFSPPWFTNFEKTFLWVAGFKPGLAFKILNNSLRDDLTHDQLERVNRLMVETRVSEKALSDEMARVQESVAAPPVSDMAGLSSGGGGDEVAEEEGMRIVREMMEGLVESGDLVRMTTARKVVEILRPIQAVKFLAAATKLQLKLRAWGLESEADGRRRRRTTTSRTTLG